MIGGKTEELGEKTSSMPRRPVQISPQLNSNNEKMIR
jgi:hypothetical protein